MTDQRDEMSRFTVKYTNQELVHIVAEIANKVRPDSPLEITQKQFDEGREKAGFADVPRAYRVAERLNRGWREVLELALTPLPIEISLSSRETNQVREKLTRSDVEHYIQAAARNLDVSELSVADYDRNRQELIDADNRKFRHRAGAREMIPSSMTIIQNVGSWEKALSWAGIAYPGLTLMRFYPAGKALDDFISDYGFAPTYRLLKDYQRKRGVRTEAFNGDFKAWREEQLETGLASRHQDVLVLKHKAKKPEGWQDLPITPIPEGYEKLRSSEITLDQCRADLIEAVRLAGEQNLTQRLYQKLSKEHQLITASAIDKVGKREVGLNWGQLRDQAVKESAKRERSQGRHLRIKQVED